MKYKATMNLLSASGYAMPFELSENSPLEISLNYGSPVELSNGKKMKSKGTDFKVAPATWLKALATGVVTGINQDPIQGTVVQVTYVNQETAEPCRYDVTYGYVGQVFCRYGQRVNAGDNIAMSKDKLHIEVRYNGELINPVDFLVMVRDNIIMES